MKLAVSIAILACLMAAELVDAVPTGIPILGSLPGAGGLTDNLPIGALPTGVLPTNALPTGALPTGLPGLDMLNSFGLGSAQASGENAQASAMATASSTNAQAAGIGKTTKGTTSGLGIANVGK